jgi:hypothetical protein
MKIKLLKYIYINLILYYNTLELLLEFRPDNIFLK